MSQPPKTSAKKLNPIQKSAIMTVLMVSLAIVTYMFGIAPTKISLKNSGETLDGLEMQVARAVSDLKSKDSTKEKIDAVLSARKPYLDALLEPLLESYAMRAKSFIEPIALETGLRALDYSEEQIRYLPIPPKSPMQLYARYPVKVTCKGSYMAIASFILRIERDYPLVSLQSLTIQSQQQNNDEQSATIILEWPTLGPNLAPPKITPQGGAK